MSPLHEVTYATLNSYSPTPQNPTNGNGMARNTSQNHISYHDYTPQLPTTQPPQRPPGSANSSQGGYYSSNSSGIGSNYPQNQQNQYNVSFLKPNGKFYITFGRQENHNRNRQDCLRLQNLDAYFDLQKAA